MPIRPPLTRVDRAGPIPVAFVQEERLLASHDIPPTPNNTCAMALQLTGPLDTEALERAVATLVQRQETLRLTFQRDDSGCHLTVTDGRDISLRRLSVENVAPGNRNARALDLVARAAETPFDLARGPLFRVLLIRLSDTEHLLGLLLDKILVERNSCVILQHELVSLYRQAAGQTDAELPELTLQFADYAAWQRDYLRGAALERLLGHWRTTLDGVDAFPDIGLADPAAPARRPPGLATFSRTIPTELIEKLEAAANEVGVSLYMVLAGALKAVVHARRREVMDDAAAADVAVLGSMANRGHRAMKDVVGCLATYTVFRTSLAGDPTVATVMERETSTVFSALGHQDIPHSLITRTVTPDQYGILHRFGTDVPHFLHFDLDNDWSTTINQPGELRVRAVRVPVAEIPRGWLRLIARNVVGGTTMVLRYRSDIFTSAWAEAFLAQYVDLLQMWPGRLNDRLSTLW